MAFTSRRVATLMVHTSPLDQAGTGDAGGMNIYVVEAAQNMAAMGVQVDIFTRRTNSDVADIVEVSSGVRVIQLNVGPLTGVTKELLPKLIPDIAEEFKKKLQISVSLPNLASCSCSTFPWSAILRTSTLIAI